MALEKRGAAALRRNGIADSDMVFQRTLGMLYRRQAREIQVSVPWRGLTAAEMEKLVEEFERVYEDLYGKGTAYKDAGIEIRRFRIDAIGRLPKPTLKKYPLGKGDPSAARQGERKVFLPEMNGFTDTPVFDGLKLAAGHVVPGPAILQYPGTTVLVGCGQKARIDEYLSCLIEGKQGET